MAEKKQILIVEDDSFLQGLIANKLEKNDFETITSSTGEEAMTEIATKKFDLLLLDLMLPDISGFEIMKNMKDMTKKIPIIVFSNLSGDKDIKKAMDLGAKEYLIKSNFTLDELVEKVKQIV